MPQPPIPHICNLQSDIQNPYLHHGSCRASTWVSVTISFMSKRMRKRGRPNVLDPAKMGEICGLLTLGSTRVLAARYVGCHPNTLRNTARRNPEFADRMRKAEQHLEFKLLQRLLEASEEKKYWRAAAWALERIYPQRYAARGPDVVTPEEVDEALRIIASEVFDVVPEDHLRAKIEARLQKLALRLSENDDLHKLSDDTLT